jgi:hypothetical protein
MWLSFTHRLIFSAFPLALIVLEGCGTAPNKPAPLAAPELSSPVAPQNETRDLTDPEKALLADGFAAGLDYSESVRFQWSKIPKSPPETFEYCALIDRKNGTGTYTGMKPFLAAIKTNNGMIIGGAIAALDSEDRDENRGVIPGLCRQKGLNPFDAK